MMSTASAVHYFDLEVEYMTYYVTCITKFPNHADPRHRITALGTTTERASTTRTQLWRAADVVAAIDAGTHTFWCTDRKRDLVRVVTVPHSGGKYLKTENDGIAQDNLLAKPDC